MTTMARLCCRKPWVPVERCWVDPDGVMTLSEKAGVARKSNGLVGRLVIDGSHASLEWEWGAVYDYVVDDQGNLTSGQGTVYWIRDQDAVMKHFFALSVGEIRKGGSIAYQVESGSIALVKGAYFEECLANSRIYARRQDIPKKYIWRGGEAVDVWQEHGRLFMLIFSYSWLSKEHPDPHCFHLTLIVQIVRTLKAYLQRFDGPDDVAVAIDYCSLWQRGAASDDRNETQLKQFGQGLQAFNDLYVHQHTTAIKLTSVPPDEPRKYYDRGWTLCESCLIDAKPGCYNRLTVDLSMDEYKSQPMPVGFAFIHRFGLCSARPPLLPEVFEEVLEERRQRAAARGLPLFTNGKDNKVVPAKYREAFLAITTAQHLDYACAQWGESEVRLLCKVLPDAAVESLVLRDNDISDEGARLLAQALVQAGTLKYLHIGGNRIEDQGAMHLVEMVARLQSLSCLIARLNPFCDAEDLTGQLEEAWIKAGKDVGRLIL